MLEAFKWRGDVFVALLFLVVLMKVERNMRQY
jgi:hypothetical protein